MEPVKEPSLDSLKVFFVKPNSVTQKEMVKELIRQEYEVYLVPEVDQALSLFRQFPKCIAFLNIDEGLTEEEWEAFIVSVQNNPEFSEVKLGVLTYNDDRVLAQRFLMEHQLPCGFIKLSLGLAESIGIVVKALEANEARGRRKYLRVACKENTRLNFKSESGLVEGYIVDISIAGMACTVDPDLVWPRNTLIEDIQLLLKGSLCLVNGIIIGSRPLDNGNRLYIMIFDPKTAEVQREKIRSYMQWALQSIVDTQKRAV